MAGTMQHGTVDYGLARRALLREYEAGRVGRRDICDAHPDLLRAAHYSGEDVCDGCPICGQDELKLVSYVFSDEFSKRENGRVWPRGDLAPLLKLREVRLYTVEVCTDCSWNHLRSQVALGRDGERQGREAST